MLPNPLYHEAVSPQFRWLVQHVPYYARWFRFLIFYPGSDGILPALRIDKEWPHPERAVNALNDHYRTQLIEYMKSRSWASACCRTTAAGCAPCNNPTWN